MLKKVDNKTKTLLILTAVIAVLAIVISSLQAAPALVIPVIAIIWFGISLLLVQINLDKRFIHLTLNRSKSEMELRESESLVGINEIQDSISKLTLESTRQLSVLKNEMLEIKSISNLADTDSAELLRQMAGNIQASLSDLDARISYEMSYANKSMSDSIYYSNIEFAKRVSESLELINKNISDIEKFGTVESKQDTPHGPARNESPINQPKATSHGRGAAQVRRDPMRESKISSRISDDSPSTILLLSSPEFEKYLRELDLGSPVQQLTLDALNGLSQINQDRLYKRPYLILEASYLSTGIWGSVLSAAGSVLFTRLVGAIQTIQTLEGFVFIAGGFDVKDTFTSSLESIVDSRISCEEFEEDWSYDTMLSIPRAIQNFVRGEN